MIIGGSSRCISRDYGSSSCNKVISDENSETAGSISAGEGQYQQQ
uniref:Uncharacterized protein n=1 Tax=Anguilla anguilla TaxID=7936 RepID=A0A0E9PD38_ANGAN